MNPVSEVVSINPEPAPDIATARTVTETHATTFALACRLLPLELRDDVYRLYTVFRSLDDLVDTEDPAAAERVGAVRAWAERDTGPLTPEVASLAHLQLRHDIPRAAIGDFCAGMEQDLSGESFITERDVDRYCYRVAGTVGVVMSALLGSCGDEASACAAALGMAMQRTNILRDIDEDLDHGRVYIAADTLGRHGQTLALGQRRDLVADQIARAEDLYAEGLSGVCLLRKGRLAIRLAAGLYREILREVERREAAGMGGRAFVTGRRKLTVASQVLLWATG